MFEDQKGQWKESSPIDALAPEAGAAPPPAGEENQSEDQLPRVTAPETRRRVSPEPCHDNSHGYATTSPAMVD